MISNKNKNIDLLISKYGRDLSDVNLEEVIFRNTNLSNVILPNDKYLFQKVQNSSCEYAIFIEKDLSIFNMENVSIKGAKYVRCLFPINSDYFSKIANKSLKCVKFIE